MNCNFDESFEDETDAEDVTIDIKDSVANHLYGEAGKLIAEDKSEIKVLHHSHLLNDQVDAAIKEVLRCNPLPFQLDEFQLLALHCLGSGKNVVLISPTGRWAITYLIKGKKCKGTTNINVSIQSKPTMPPLHD